MRKLANSKIRIKRPGLHNNYYEIHENLDEYLLKILHNYQIEPDTLEMLGGSDNVNIKVINKANTSYVVKICPWDNYLGLSTNFFDLIKNSNIPFPQVFKFDDSHSVIPFDYQILKFIPGIGYKNLNHNLKIQAAKETAKILLDLHSIELKVTIEFNWLQNLQNDLLVSNFLKNKDKYLSSELIDKIESLTFYNSKLLVQIPSIIHADANETNFIYSVNNNEVELLAIIDPNNINGSNLGDPMFDLAWVNNNDELFAQELISEYFRIAKPSSEDLYRFEHLYLLTLYWFVGYWYTTESNKFASKKYQLLQQMKRCNSDF